MSGIYIPGMEMPNGGYRTVEILFDADGFPMALADGGDVFDVIPVPPHGRLIDADALKIYQMEENVRADGDPNEYEYDAGLIDGLHIAAKDVSVAPTIIPAEGGDADAR